jgi:hypothetical protein
LPARSAEGYPPRAQQRKQREPEVKRKKEWGTEAIPEEVLVEQEQIKERAPHVQSQDEDEFELDQHAQTGNKKREAAYPGGLREAKGGGTEASQSEKSEQKFHRCEVNRSLEKEPLIGDAHAQRTQWKDEEKEQQECSA